ncbi:MAG: acyl carrier protein [Candidatus Limivicinus sp.]|jgi:acyl carrier protein
MKEKILEICKEVLPFIDMESSDHLVDDGILDSLAITTLVMELSVEFDVEFDLDSLTAGNMNSIDAIVDTVTKLQNSR